jgi:hypothetical protein
MIERKNKYVRIRVIGGSGIFDSIMNILKKPVVSKLLTSAGKSVASALGERLVNSMMPLAPAVLPPQPALPMVAPATALPRVLPPAVLPPATLPQQPSRAQELIAAYGAKHTGTGMSRQAVPKGSTAGRVAPQGAGVITLQDYMKSHKGAGIKLI